MRTLVIVVVLAAVAPRASADDPAPQPTVAVSPKPHSSRTKWIAAGSIAAMHGVYLTWQYFAWYRKGSQPFHFEHDAALDVDTYAGGVDKFGHAWSNYVMTRGTTAILVAGGWPRLQSSLVSFGLTELAFLMIEIQDGLAPWGFDKNDLAANLVGGTFGLLMTNLPALDRLIDFRLEYWPSPRYRNNVKRTGDLDGAQDYTGQSYLLALHLGALGDVAETDWGYWTRYIDLAVGFEAKHYYPVPDPFQPRQTMYAGLSINMQGVLRALLPESRGRRIGIGIAEAYSLPYTTFRYAELSRSPP